MIYTIIIISIAFVWLMYESKWLTIRLSQYHKPTLIAPFESMASLLPLIISAIFIYTAINMLNGIERWVIKLEGRWAKYSNSLTTLDFYANIKRNIINTEKIPEIINVKMITENRIINEASVDIEPLDIDIKTKELKICNNYQWHIVEKHPNYEMYKLIGLHNKYRGLNCLYIIGKDKHTNTPYILRCPFEFEKSPILECIGWNIGMQKEDELIEV